MGLEYENIGSPGGPEMQRMVENLLASRRAQVEVLIRGAHMLLAAAEEVGLDTVYLQCDQLDMVVRRRSPSGTVPT